LSTGQQHAVGGSEVVTVEQLAHIACCFG